jgi:phage gpG-like protein
MAEGMRLTIVGGEALRERLARGPVDLSKAMRDAMQRSLDVVYRKVADNLTGKVLHVQTGRLRQSIQTAVEEGGQRGRIGTNVEYAAIHEYGGQTKPHVITARGKALRFVSPRFVGPVKLTAKGKLAKRQTAGSIVFARKVSHPGSTIPARPFLRPALRDSQEEIKAILKSGLAEILK